MRMDKCPKCGAWYFEGVHPKCRPPAPTLYKCPECGRMKATQPNELCDECEDEAVNITFEDEGGF